MPHTPTTRQPLLLASMPHATCLNVPPFPKFIRPPFSALGLHPVPCQPQGDLSVVGAIRLPFVSASPSLCAAPLTRIFWLLVFLLGVHFYLRTRGQGASTPWKSLAPSQKISKPEAYTRRTSDVSTSVKEIWIGNVLLLETFLLKFLPAPELFRRKDALGWVWVFFIYLSVGSFNDPEQGGGLFVSKS